MTSYTVTYRGYQIDPIRDPYQTGDWVVCNPSDAECFRVYPPDENEPALDIFVVTLNDAMIEIDEHIGEM